jgi:tetratricopeptide (TPR) repeat protein
MGALQNNARTEASSSPGPSASSSPSQAELEAQAKGYQLVLQREPDNQTALRGLVDVRIQQGKVKEIIEPLEKLAKLNPDQPDYTVLLAQAKQRTGDREGAAEAYRSILSTRPGDLNALQGLVGLLMQQQRPEAAIGLLQDTLKTADEANRTKPGSVDTASVQLMLGEVYARQGRYEESLSIYDQLIQADRQNFRPVLAKALVLQAQGKNDEAKPLFVSAASLAPTEYKDQIKKLATGDVPSPSPSSPSPGSSKPSSNAEPTQTPAASPSPAAPAESPTPAQ